MLNAAVAKQTLLTDVSYPDATPCIPPGPRGLKLCPVTDGWLKVVLYLSYRKKISLGVGIKGLKKLAKSRFGANNAAPFFNPMFCEHMDTVTVEKEHSGHCG